MIKLLLFSVCLLVIIVPFTVYILWVVKQNRRDAEIMDLLKESLRIRWRF